MTLTEKEYQLFHKLNWGLLYYVNEKNKLIDYTDDFKDFNGIAHQDWAKIRNFTHDNNQIPAFIIENPYQFNDKELDILSEWDELKIRGDFIIAQTNKEGAIFIDNKNSNKIYSVCGLVKPFEMMFPNNYLPLMVTAVLLPLQNKIIYDGLISHYNISIGSNMTRSIKEEYKINKAKFGIINDLHNSTISNSINYEELLKTYLKNPDYYQEEIEEIINQDEKNYILYSNLISKTFFRKYKREIKDIKFKNKIYFALYFSSILLASDNKEDLERQIRKNFDKEITKFILIESIGK